MTRVLVIESKKSFSEALSSLLRGEGVAVAVAAVGTDAVAEFDRAGADVVLLDVTLPQLLGAPTYHQVERRSPIVDAEATATLVGGPILMDLDRHTVTVDGRGVQLPLKEFDLLELLLRNAGRVLTRGQLIDRVWGDDYVGNTKTLDVHVKRLRSKIEPEPSTPRYLITIRGLGYKFEA